MLQEAKITKAVTELHQGSPFGPHFHQLIKGTAWTHMLGSAKAAPGCSSSFAKEMTHSFLSDLCRHFRLLISSANGPRHYCELPQTGAPGLKPLPSQASWTNAASRTLYQGSQGAVCAQVGNVQPSKHLLPNQKSRGYMKRRCTDERL